MELRTSSDYKKLYLIISFATMHRIIVLLLGISMAIPCSAQKPATLKIRDYVSRNQSALVEEYFSFLTIPNVASDTQGIQRNANFIAEMMKKRNIQNVQLLKAKNGKVHPAVYGEVNVKGAKQTLIFYAHYDGQPVNPSQWAAGLSPFRPVLYSNIIGKGEPVPAGAKIYDPEWRIYSRGASDDKAGVMAILNAYDAIVKTNQKLTYNIKFFFEGEEEAGSPNLDEILQNNSSLLSSDLWIICDGPVHQTGRKIVSFGVRGDAHVNVTVYGPKRPLHSGHYGNWAPNPGHMLARLLSTMKDDQGRVTIQGFYDDVQPLSEVERKALQQIPNIDEEIKKELGLSWTENSDRSLSEAINMPSLNINGMQSGNVGKMASNQIPTSASAVLDLRLVLGNDWRKQQQKVIDHIRSQGYDILDREPTDDERLKYKKLAMVIAPADGYNAQRTSMDLPIAQKVVKAVQSTTSEGVISIPTMGGSLPLFIFEQYLGAKTISVPIANHDNNQHAENENIKIGNLFSGIETMAAIMMMDEK
jgi:acetylornithine deacetylase/succinyl-diaminopimelate desuccinylase-like protein